MIIINNFLFKLIDKRASIDEEIIIKEAQSELTSIDVLPSINKQYQLNYNEFSTDENEYEAQNIKMHDTKKSTNMMSITTKNEYKNDMDVIDHHDSDTESFYNIWGDDEEWLYDNKLRNTVRNIHR